MRPKSEVVCTAELAMRAAATMTMSCGQITRIWRLLGLDISSQLSRCRGVKLEGLGTVAVTAEGVVLQQRGATSSRGSGPAGAINYTSICPPGSCSRSEAARGVRAIIGELKKCARCHEVGELWLRPVGKLKTRGGDVELIINEDFAETAAKTWNDQLVSKRRGCVGQLATFRGDDRCFARRRHKVEPPPAYASVVGKKYFNFDPRTGASSQNVRRRLTQRHGPDALCVFGRALAASEGDTRAAMEDCGLELSTAEEYALGRGLREVERSLAVDGALSTARRHAIDRSWRALCVDYSRVDSAKTRGAPAEGGWVEVEKLPLFFVTRRCRADWHPHVVHGLLTEDRAVARIVGHLEPNRNDVVTRNSWRATHARLSAAFEGTDEAFELFLARLWSLPANERIRATAPVFAWQQEQSRDETDAEHFLNDTIDEGALQQDTGAVMGVCDQLRHTLASFEALREVLYEPPCTTAEFEARLGFGCVAGPTLLTVNELSRRVQRRSAMLAVGWSLDHALGVCRAALGTDRVSVESLRSTLAAIFGRSAHEARAALGPFVALVPVAQKLALVRDSDKFYDLAAFRRMLGDTLGLGALDIKQSDGLFRACADGARVISLRDVATALAKATPPRPRRIAALGRLHNALRECSGDANPVADRHKTLFGEHPISLESLIYVYNVLYGAVLDSDFDFYQRLRDAWELNDTSWVAIEDALFGPVLNDVNAAPDARADHHSHLDDSKYYWALRST